MPYLILAIGIGFGIYGLYRFFVNASVKQVSAMFMVGGFIVICAALFFLAVTGRLPAAVELVVALWPIGLSLWHKRHDPPKAEQSVKSTPMTRAEALDILNLEDGASKKEIKDSYTKLMKKVHPDQEGSKWMAAKLNEARDILLDK